MKLRLALLISFFVVSTVSLAQAPAGREFKGHGGLVFSVAFSPDGKVLATGSFDNTVKLWDFASGKEIQTLKGHTASVYGIAFSPDGSILASGSQDKTIRLWNPKDGKLLKELKGHGDIVNALAFSNDGKVLASAGSDKTVRLWNPADGKEIKNLGSHKESVYTIVFSPDNQLLASGSKDTTIKLWDLKAMKEVRTMPAPEPAAKPEPKKEMKKAAKDKKEEKKVAKKDEKKKDEPKKVVPVEVKEFRDAVTGLTFSADGKQLISVGCDNMVRVWDVATGKETKKIGPTPDWIFGLAVSRDKKHLATAGYGGHLFLWDLNAGKPTFSQHLKRWVTYCVAFTPDGKGLVTGHEKDNAALVTPLPATALVATASAAPTPSPATPKTSPAPVAKPAPKTVPAKVAASTPDPRWTKKLANGVTVELIGVARHPSQPGSWWKPDGTPLAGPPYAKLNGAVNPTAQAWEFALRLHDLPADGVDLNYDFAPPAGASMNIRFPKSGSQPFEVVGIATTLHKAGKMCTVRVGVAAGPWTKEFASAGRAAINGKVSVVFGGPREVKQQHTAISVSLSPAQTGWRLVVIDTDGKTHAPVAASSSATGTLAQIEAEFALPPSRIREFQLQSRGIQVAEFPDVALFPGGGSSAAPK